MDRWLRTDEELESLHALETICNLLPWTAEKPHYWKWVVVALDNAFQGYMVLGLCGGNSFNVLSKKSQLQRSKAWKQKSRLLPAPRLDNFLNLYKKIQKGRDIYEQEKKVGRMLGGSEIGPMMMYVHSQPFKPAMTSERFLGGSRERVEWGLRLGRHFRTELSFWGGRIFKGTWQESRHGVPGDADGARFLIRYRDRIVSGTAAGSFRRSGCL